MKTLLLSLALSLPAAAQTPMPAIPPTGHVPTSDVDIAYWVYGAPHHSLGRSPRSTPPKHQRAEGPTQLVPPEPT